MQTAEVAQAPASPRSSPRYLDAAAFDASSLVSSEARLSRFLAGLPGVDQVGCEARAARARDAVDQDDVQAPRDRPRDLDDQGLTTLEGADTEGKVRNLCAKAAARARGPDRASGRRGVRLPRPRGDRRARARGLARSRSRRSRRRSRRVARRWR